MSTALQQAKARLQGQETRLPSLVNRDAIQYCWYAPFYNITHRDFGKVERLRWTPITRQEQWVSIAAKPNPEDFVAVRNNRAEVLKIRPAPPPTQGLIWVKPGAIADSMAQEFGEWGLLISSALAGLSLSEFEQLNLDGLFFPMLAERLPQTYRETKERIEKVLTGLTKPSSGILGTAQLNAYKNLSPHLQKVTLAVGDEMLKSLERSKTYQANEIGITHGYFEAARSGKIGSRGTYDARDRQMMTWLEIVPQDEVMNLSAQANTQLIELAKAQLTSGGQQIDYAKLGEGIAAGLMSAGVIAKPDAKPEK